MLGLRTNWRRRSTVTRVNQDSSPIKPHDKSLGKAMPDGRLVLGGFERS